MENLIPFLVVIGYLLMNFLGKFVERRNDQLPSEAEEGTSSVDEVLQEMMRQAGFAPEQPVAEQPVASEHRPTRGEHRETASEHRATRSERRPTPSEHRQTVAEVFATRSEHMVTASEHRLSPGEHRKGDFQLPPVPRREKAEREKAPDTTHKTRSKFGKAVVADLRGGARPLAQAFVLSEILGPPVSLKGQQS